MARITVALSALLLVSLISLSACTVAEPSELQSESPPANEGFGETIELPPTAEQNLTVENTAEQNLTVENLRVPAGLSAEEYSQTVIADRLSKWIMAGTGTEELYDQYLAIPDSEKLAWRDAKAAAYGEIMADSLFVPDWRDRPDLVLTYDHFVANNSAALDNWLRTMKGNSGEIYNAFFTVDSVEELPGSETNRDIRSNLTEHNNAAESVIGQTYRPEMVERVGDTFTFRFTTQVIDGTEYIASWIR